MPLSTVAFGKMLCFVFIGYKRHNSPAKGFSKSHQHKYHHWGYGFFPSCREIIPWQSSEWFFLRRVSKRNPFKRGKVEFNASKREKKGKNHADWARNNI